MSCRTAAAIFSASLIISTAAFAEPKVVAGPGADPQCFKPWAKDTTFLQWPKKEGPYRLALANGFVGNTWRIQMVQSARAYAETPEVKPLIKELKIVSTGTDVAAQIAAIDSFINAGYDAVIVEAVNPTALTPVIRRANKAGVILVPFDNTVDSKDVMMVNEDQTKIGTLSADWLVKNLPVGKGKILEVRGLAGNSVDRDRHLGFRKVMEADGRKFDIVEVVGNWDDGTAQKAVADAISVHKSFDGIFAQAGTTGVVRALIDSGHKMVPIAGADENGFRKLCATRAKDGLLCASIGQSPGLVAISMKAALSALQGNAMPQMISVPIPAAYHPDFKPGENVFPDLNDNFFTTNEFAPCNVNLKATEIMSKSSASN